MNARVLSAAFDSRVAWPSERPSRRCIHTITESSGAPHILKSPSPFIVAEVENCDESYGATVSVASNST